MRFGMFSRGFPGRFLIIISFIIIIIFQPIGLSLAVSQEAVLVDSEQQTEKSSTISYGPDFFARFSNAITALDIIQRIPSGATILNSGGSSNRGFSSNDDRILINGKRLSGKSNDSESALGRITIDQIARIDVIRGTSPDVKVSSQESIINIILKEGSGNGGSGTWRIDADINRGPQVGFGGSLSYGGSLGDFDYFVSFATDPRKRRVIQNEMFFDGLGTLTEQLDETIQWESRQNRFAGNFGYTFKGGQILRLNALYEDEELSKNSAGVLTNPDGMGGFVFSGNSARFEKFPRPVIEISGDFEADLSDTLRLKIIALYSENDRGSSRREDFLIEGVDPVDDFVFSDNSEATEKIGRTSLTWQAAAAHGLEIGVEIAINELDVGLSLVENDGFGNLLPVEIPGSQVLVKETRNEPFVIHSWKVSEKVNIDSSLVLEIFKISQNGVDTNVTENFFFFRPSVDFRFNLTENDQFQISARRRIEQLDFRNFAASTSGDDEVIGANVALSPEKVWAFEASYERRLGKDGGRIKGSVLYEKITDRIERIEVSEGVSGVGNIGNAWRLIMTLDASIRLGFIGLPEAIIELQTGHSETRVTDPFTGQTRRRNVRKDHWFMMNFRHDVSALGLSWGGEFAHYYPWQFHDLDEVIHRNGRTRVDFFLEKKLFGTTKLRFDARDLTDTNDGRVRTLFEDGVAGGVVTGVEIRDRRHGRTYQISFIGTF